MSHRDKSPYHSQQQSPASNRSRGLLYVGRLVIAHHQRQKDAL